MTTENKLSKDAYSDEFRKTYDKSRNFKAGGSWDDYGPAYRYSYDRYNSDMRGKRYEDVESDLQLGWEEAKANSKLAWAEAKHAVNEG